MIDKISNYPAKIAFSDLDLKDVSSTSDGGANYVSEKVTYGQEKDNLATEFHRQGGNSYNDAYILGTNDNHPVMVEVNNQLAFSVATDKKVTFQEGIRLGLPTNYNGQQDSYIKHMLLDPTTYTNLSFMSSSTYIQANDILAVNVIITALNGNRYPPEYSFDPTYKYSWEMIKDGGGFGYIVVKSSSSALLNGIITISLTHI